MNIVTKIRHVSVISQQVFKISPDEHTQTLIFFFSFQNDSNIIIIS